MPAAFWDNPDSPDDTPVIRHGGDPNTYQYPDERMLDRMPMGKVGAFAVVPAARSDGTSRGFSHDEPGVVHVDPDAPDGGAIVDYSHVGQREMNQALRNAHYPHQVYYQLGQSPGRMKVSHDDWGAARQQQVAPRSNPHIPPGSYVTPRAIAGGGQAPAPVYGGASSLLPLTQVLSQDHMEPLPLPGAPTAHPSAPPVQQAPPQYAQPQYAQPPQQQYAPPPGAQYAPPPQAYQQPPQPYYPPQGPDPSTQQAISQLTQLVTGLAQQVNNMQQVRSMPLPNAAPRLNTAPMSAGRAPSGPPVHVRPPQQPYQEQEDEQAAFDNPPPMPEPRQRPQAAPRRQTLAEYQEEEPANDTLLVGFETLNIPFITGPVPVKATRRVVFELPEAGKMSGVYHDVVESPSCVVLVYDSRYEDGNQYMPPNLGDKPITIQIPQGKTVKKHVVTSMDLAFSVGVLDCIVLVKTEEAEALDDDQR